MPTRLRILTENDWTEMNKTVTAVGDCRNWTGKLEAGQPYYFGHRVRNVIYRHMKGEAPTGTRITQACRNPLCINVEHMETKVGGGGAYRVVTPDTRGTKNFNNILSETDVNEIRNLYGTTNTSYIKLGEKFGVHSSTIGLIIRGKNWVWLKATPMPVSRDGANTTSKGDA